MEVGTNDTKADFPEQPLKQKSRDAEAEKRLE